MSNCSEHIEFVRSRYPDAYMWAYASLSMVIWCPMLKCRLSGFFHTPDEAWEDAVKWIEKKESVSKPFMESNKTIKT